MWEAICTMTTVGFGDIFPRTFLGRIIALFCSLFGLTITSMLVIVSTKILTMESPESASFTVIEKLDLRKKIKDTALKMILKINEKKFEKQEKIDSKENYEFLRYQKIKK